MSDTEEGRRIEAAQKRDLPETASWSDICNRVWDLIRNEKAKQYGLPATASWSDINDHVSKTSAS